MSLNVSSNSEALIKFEEMFRKVIEILNYTHLLLFYPELAS